MQISSTAFSINATTLRPLDFTIDFADDCPTNQSNPTSKTDATSYCYLESMVILSALVAEKSLSNLLQSVPTAILNEEDRCTFLELDEVDPYSQNSFRALLHEQAKKQMQAF